jgi:RNA polymerase sigma factor (sigma-70 family)
MTDDRQLLARYVAEVSEEAFAELTRRYMGLVYSAALRQVRNEQLAQDVTQVVFANLARQARSIPEGTVLAGWLHRDTRYTALDFLRAEARRLRREQQSVEMNATNPDPQPGWEEIRPLLDEALTKLAPADRDALLLRYFEQRDFAGVGAALGASAEAARKRVDRALERLREQLVKRGITTTAAALGFALTAHAVETVPAGMVVSLAAGSADAAAPGAGSWLSNLMLMTKTKIAIGAALLAGILATPLIIQQQALATARVEQSELLSRLRDLPAQTVQPARQIPGMIDIAARDRADLERLRLEAAALQTEIAEFSAQAQQLAAASPWHKPGGIALGEFLRASDARDVGQSTPSAAAQSMLWALMHADTNRISQLTVLDAGANAQMLQKALEQLSKNLSENPNDLKSAMESMQLRALEEQPGENTDRWLLGEAIETNGSPIERGRFLLRPTDTGWRFVIGGGGGPVEEPIRDQDTEAVDDSGMDQP